jgi:quinol monooxygenase YgiN
MKQFAQLIKMKVKPGAEDRITDLDRRWEEQVGRPDGNWERTQHFRSNDDPATHYLLVTFKDEAAARANEANPAHQELMKEWPEMVDGEPTFIDLTQVDESSR